METIEEIERLRESLPLKPKDDAVDILIKRKQIGKNVLLYRSAFVKNPLSNQKEKMVKCICTACGGECYQTYFKPKSCSGHYIPAPFGFISDNGEEIISGNSCLCPLCASPVEALHIGAFKASREIDYCFFNLYLRTTNIATATKRRTPMITYVIIPMLLLPFTSAEAV